MAYAVDAQIREMNKKLTADKEGEDGEDWLHSDAAQRMSLANPEMAHCRTVISKFGGTIKQGAPLAIPTQTWNEDAARNPFSFSPDSFRNRSQPTHVIVNGGIPGYKGHRPHAANWTMPHRRADRHSPFLKPFSNRPTRASRSTPRTPRTTRKAARGSRCLQRRRCQEGCRSRGTRVTCRAQRTTASARSAPRTGARSSRPRGRRHRPRRSPLRSSADATPCSGTTTMSSRTSSRTRADGISPCRRSASVAVPSLFRVGAGHCFRASVAVRGHGGSREARQGGATGRRDEEARRGGATGRRDGEARRSGALFMRIRSVA